MWKKYTYITYIDNTKLVLYIYILFPNRYFTLKLQLQMFIENKNAINDRQFGFKEYIGN